MSAHVLQFPTYHICPGCDVEVLSTERLCPDCLATFEAHERGGEPTCVVRHGSASRNAPLLLRRARPEPRRTFWDRLLRRREVCL